MSKQIQQEVSTFSRRRQKDRSSALLGATVLILAAIGAITIVVLAIWGTTKIFDDSKQKRMFEQFIAPVVMVDPVPFDSLQNADNQMLLMSSMWSVLMNSDKDYPEGDFGMVIPATDLDVFGAKLFGKDIVLHHESFGDAELLFEYDSETQSYSVPPMGYILQYEPKVEKIEKKGSVYTLTVGYIAPGSTIENKNKDTTPEPDKRMLYVIKKLKKGQYCIVSISDVKSGDYPVYSQSEQVSSWVGIPVDEVSSQVSTSGDSSSAVTSAATSSNNTSKAVSSVASSK